MYLLWLIQVQEKYRSGSTVGGYAGLDVGCSRTNNQGPN